MPNKYGQTIEEKEEKYVLMRLNNYDANVNSFIYYASFFMKF